MNLLRSFPYPYYAAVASVIVSLLPRPAMANSHIGNISLNMESPAVVSPAQRIHLDFDYSTTESPHMFVYGLPMYQGSLVAHNGSSGSAYLTGSGSDYYWFYLNEGDQIDSILLYAIDSVKQVVLDKVTIPFEAECEAYGAVVTGFSSTQPAGFSHSEDLYTNLAYNVTVPGGVRVSVRPITG